MNYSFCSPKAIKKGHQDTSRNPNDCMVQKAHAAGDAQRIYKENKTVHINHQQILTSEAAAYWNTTSHVISKRQVSLNRSNVTTLQQYGSTASILQQLQHTVSSQHYISHYKEKQFAKLCTN